MLLKEQVITKIKESGLVAVIRGSNTAEVNTIVEKCLEGGLKNVEITFTIPYAHKIIEDISRKYGDDIILGAGTVLDSETARIAILSGAQYIVSPHFNPEVIRLCNRYQKTGMAGIMTVTEAVNAMEAGTDILKLFPGELYGPAFIKAIRGPLPYAQIMPTGGVDIDNIGRWIAAGAVAVGVGSNLTKGNVTGNVKAYLKAINEERSKVKP